MKAVGASSSDSGLASRREQAASGRSDSPHAYSAT